MGASSNLLMATNAGASGVSQFGAAYVQSQAQKSQGEYQRRVGEMNASMAKLQGEDAIRRGDKAATLHNKKVANLTASQRVAAAAQGIDPDSGSSLDLQADTAFLGELDAMAIKNNAWREAFGYEVQAMNASAQGEFAEMTGKNASRNTLITGGLNAVGAAGQAVYYAKRGKRNYYTGVYEDGST